MSQEERTRIVFIIPSLDGGGAERVLVTILTYLNREKFMPYLVLFEKKGVYLKQVPDDVIIYDLKKKGRTGVIKLILQLSCRVLPEIRPGLIVSFLQYTNLISIIANGITRYKSPVVITEHIALSKSLQYNQMKLFYTLGIRNLYPRAKKIIAVSNSVAKDLLTYFPPGSLKIQVIYNPIDISLISFLAGESDLNQNIPETKTNSSIIVSCGRLVHQKNYALLLRAFAQILGTCDAHLILVGDGEEKNRLINLAHDLGIADKVTFLGFQENPFQFFAGSTLFVLSSDSEGFGNVIVEAMACAVPVISTDSASGPAEIINDGIDGILVPVGDVHALADAILRVLTDEPLRKRLAEAGKQRAEDFRAEKILAEYERVFETISNG